MNDLTDDFVECHQHSCYTYIFVKNNVNTLYVRMHGLRTNI